MAERCACVMRGAKKPFVVDVRSKSDELAAVAPVPLIATDCPATHPHTQRKAANARNTFFIGFTNTLPDCKREWNQRYPNVVFKIRNKILFPITFLG
jgi:hypothetical protein